jgi:spore coat protein U-like protein
MRRTLILAAGLLLALLFPGQARACIGLGCSCSVSAPAMSFGLYNPLSLSAVNSGSSIHVTCSTPVLGVLVSYTLAMSPGVSGSYSARRLRSGANTLQYNLYTSPSHATVWGNGTAGTGTVADSHLFMLFSHTHSYSVYGRLPGGQNVPPGVYNDTITLTVTY